MLINKRTVRIEWGDCDPAGIIFYPRYFEFFDACTNALFERALGMPKHVMLEKYAIVGMPVVEARASFLSSASFDDGVVIESSVTAWGRSSFSILHRLHAGNVPVVEGFEKRVWAMRSPDDPKRIQSQQVPSEVIERFAVPTSA
jgi:4-hydroxybenzoyl-CoA thioesterase